MRIREGNDFNVAWKIFQAGAAVDLSQVTEKKLTFSVYGKKVVYTNYTVSGQTLTIEFPKEVTTVKGDYRLIFEYTIPDSGQSDGDLKRTTDVVAFRIVPFTADADTVMAVDVSSDVAIAFKGDKGDQGYDAYHIWLDLGNTGTYEDYIAWLRQPAVDAGASIAELEDTIEGNESDRVVAENERDEAEELRIQAETLRSNAESGRVIAEGLRDDAEALRISAETPRATAEADRVLAETSRATAEADRVQTEDERKAAESTRVSNENNRVTAEGLRVNAENLRVTAESSRELAESLRVDVETVREQQEQGRQTNTQIAITNAENATENANTAAQNADDARLAIQDDLALKADQTELDQLAGDLRECLTAEVDGTVKQKGEIVYVRTKDSSVENEDGISIDRIYAKKKPSIVFQQAKDLYYESSQPTDDGILPTSNSRSSGYIRVNEGDIVNVIGGYGRCSFFNEAKDDRVMLPYPATAPLGYPYAVIHLGIQGDYYLDSWVQIIPKEDVIKIGAESVNFITNEISKNPKLLESAQVSFKKYESIPRVIESSNLLNKDNVQIGRVRNRGVGEKVDIDDNDMYFTTKILVDKISTITARNVRVLLFSDIENIQLSSATVTTASTTNTLDVPPNAVYMYVSFDSNPVYVDLAQVNEGSELLPYSKYSYDLTYNGKLLLEDIYESALFKSDLKTKVISNQHFNNKDYLVGMFISASGLLTTSTGDAMTTGKIYVPEKATNVNIRGVEQGVTLRASFYDINDEPLPPVIIFTNTANRTIPYGAEYLHVYFKTSSTPIGDILDTMVVNFSEVPLEQDEFTERLYSVDGNIINSGQENINPPIQADIPTEYLHSINDSTNNNFSHIQKLKEDTEDAIKSLLDLQGVDGGEFEINIPPGESFSNLNLRLHLHHGEQRGDILFDEVFLNGACKTDFSDIRFEDDLGNNLDFKIHSTGNYDIVKDRNLRLHTIANSKGYLIGYNPTFALSKDNASTWVDIYPEFKLRTIGIDSNDNLFAYNLDNQGIYKLDFDGENYINLREVHSLAGSTSFVNEVKPFTEDTIGNLYMAKYQTEWDVEIFKSTDSGETWTTCFQTYENQHVHQLFADPYTGYVYAGLDGQASKFSSKQIRCIRSIDNGATWQDLPIPFANADYGLAFSGNGYRLGHGEGSITGGTSIYKTTDDVNFYSVLDGLQGVRQIVDFNGRLLAGAQAGQGARVAQLFSSVDEGETWRTIFAENWRPTVSSGSGIRFISEKTTPFGTAEEQCLIGLKGHETWYPPMRFFNGGDNYHALVYVDVGEVPVEGKTIKIKYGYSVKYPRKTIQKDLSERDSLTFRLKTNERRGDLLRDSISGNIYRLDDDKHIWQENAGRYGIVYPYDRKPIASGIILNESKLAIDKAVLPNETFSLAFWMNSSRENNTPKKHLFGDPDSIHFFMVEELLYFSDGTNNYSIYGLISNRLNETYYMHYTLVFDKDAMTITRYYEDGQKLTVNITDWDNGSEPSKCSLGGSSLALSDVRVYSEALTDDDVKNMYYGCEQIQP